MRFAMALALLAGMAHPSFAAWQWTDWGMSEDEVVSSAPGRITRLHEGAQEEDTDVRLFSRHSAVGAEFTVEFTFRRDQGLAAVKMTATDPSICPVVLSGLSEKYGFPDGSRGGALRRTYWFRNDETISLFDLNGTLCEVSYIGHLPANTEGL